MLSQDEHNSLSILRASAWWADGVTCLSRVGWQVSALGQGRWVGGASSSQGDPLGEVITEQSLEG